MGETSIKVCYNKRISFNKVFRGLAKRSNPTSGCFYGFKLRIINNDQGEVLAFQIAPGNIFDVSMMETLSKELT